ncbi:hypothetical protein MYSTI_01145 [Myxococcus stipitatus DSM 14675]|uniref:Uncharacterized protein n=1 Tax=Myxococcus stipitatus (strain DSM 14675 / JCM 12634 / Mx s8) TaxID=1278073 RepID=L7U7P2_MYXSD|nr:hypothetical protein [Myxococcus stipitatus]AGC42494.1 hypothetical protein MYSTI_01145 [Myxococcus stipitatus DSM 14675]
MRRIVLAAAVAFFLGGFAQQAHAERQPRMRDAVVHLEKALSALQNASPDKGGHRVKAIALTEQALGEVREGIKHDNRN